VSHEFANFQSLVNKAILQENSKRELDEHRKRKAPQGQHGAGSSRQKNNNHPGYRGASTKTAKPNNFQHNAYRTPMAEVGGNHANTTGRACYHCGIEGHFVAGCPSKNMGVTPVKFNLGSAAKTPAAGRGRGILPTPGGGHQASGQPGRGQVNHITAEQAHQASDVVLGMFPINSCYGPVLFDSGASHSFVSKKFVEKHHLKTEGMSRAMAVQSPGGILTMGLKCPNVIITIEGVEFLANLIVLDSKGLDVILGMNWLGKQRQ
jgi:predicted aspartyl protease